MRYLIALGCSVAVIAAVLPGCVADHASALDEKSSAVKLPDKPANPDDPFGSCTDHVDDGIDQVTCSIPGLSCFGWGDFGVCEDGQCEYARRWEWCDHYCEETSECPVPITGDAEPKCVGTCILPCDDPDTVCPDGFMCWSPSEVNGWSDAYDRVCVQYYSTEPWVPVDPEFIW